MEAIAEREIDDAISSAERHGRLRPLGCQRMQARANAACQNDTDRVVLHDVSSSIPSQGRRELHVLLKVADTLGDHDANRNPHRGRNRSYAGRPSAYTAGVGYERTQEAR